MVGISFKPLWDRLLDAPRYIVALVIIFGALVSGAVFTSVHRNNQHILSARFEDVTKELGGDLVDHLRLYEHGLRGARGAIIAMGRETSRLRYHHYAASRDLVGEFAGTRGFGFVRRVAPADLPAFLLAARADGAPDFKLRQLQPHTGDLFVTQYIEPLAPNEAAIGLDMASEHFRRDAALLAGDTGESALTGPITLVQAPHAAGRAFLMFAPVYTPDSPLGTIAERRAALIGWTYAPILAEGILQAHDLEFNDIGFTLADAAVAEPFYVTHRASPLRDDLVGHVDLPLFGRVWRLDTRATGAFVAKFGLPSPGLLAGGTFSFFLLLAVTMHGYLVGRRRTRIATFERNRLATIVETSNDAIISGSLDCRVMTWNAAAERFFGYSAQEAIGRNVFDLIIPPDRAREAKAASEALSRGEIVPPFATLRRHKDGRLRHALVSLSPIKNAAGEIIGAAAIERDIGAQKEAEAEILRLNAELARQVADRTEQLEKSLALQSAIQHMALHDALTNLPNRTLFCQKLVAAMKDPATTPGFAVLVCDLDRFKAVNDTYGHLIGDAVLKVVAERLRRSVRGRDVVARFGGDEFAILLADSSCANRVCERLIRSVNEPMTIEGLRVEIGLSIGIAFAAVEPVDHPDELVKRADSALYRAKHAGRNTHQTFHPEQDAALSDHSHLALDMREAVRRGDFTLAFQPLLDSRSGATLGFEALARWSHPTRGEVRPDEFIPLAEDTGLIIPLGQWALQQACRAAVTWPGNLRVAVNVSALQLRQGGLESIVVGALAASRLPASRLEIEVTESVLLHDTDDVLRCLHRLQDLGIAIALDDFGTGFSSLSYLSRFHFNKIKIDRTFIRDIADPDAAAIVRGIVDIGTRVGMEIVAEGVETEEQYAFVRDIGCSTVQGFLFSKPLPEEEAARFAWAPLRRRPGHAA